MLHCRYLPAGPKATGEKQWLEKAKAGVQYCAKRNIVERMNFYTEQPYLQGAYQDLTAQLVAAM